MKQGSTYLEGTCYLHDPGAGVQRERWNSNICGLAGLCCGLLYGFMGIVQLWKNTTANRRYFLVMRTAGSCWMSVFCCLTRVEPSFSITTWTFSKTLYCTRAFFCAGECMVVTSALFSHWKWKSSKITVHCKIWCVAFPMFVVQICSS